MLFLSGKKSNFSLYMPSSLCKVVVHWLIVKLLNVKVKDNQQVKSYYLSVKLFFNLMYL